MIILQKTMYSLMCLFLLVILKLSSVTSSDICNLSMQNLLSSLHRPSLNREDRLPPGFQTTKDLILINGFGYKEYRVETEDGYILRVHRIIGKNPGGPPVLFQHGAIFSSDSFLLNNRKSDLAFQLADAGYDVWLNDRRGDWYSREHVLYKPNSRKYWDFSFHESGYYDLPAVIDYIIKATNYSQIFFVGHSMGATEFCVMASTRTEYNAKVKLAILLSPVCNTPKVQEVTSSPLRFLISNGDILYESLAGEASLYEVFARQQNLLEMLGNCCKPSKFLQICLIMYELMFGDNSKNLDKTRFANKLSHWPAGASTKTMHHLTQLFKKGFVQYDYGAKENLIRYHTVNPPSYPLNEISSPVALYWSLNDPYINERAVKELATKLPHVRENHKVEDPKYGHLDFVWGINTKYLVNKRIIKLLKTFV